MKLSESEQHEMEVLKEIVMNLIDDSDVDPLDFSVETNYFVDRLRELNRKRRKGLKDIAMEDGTKAVM
jgi:hypothetical protein